jgi:hypothetical protein
LETELEICPQLGNQSEILLVQYDEPIRDPSGEAISDPYGMENLRTFKVWQSCLLYKKYKKNNFSRLVKGKRAALPVLTMAQWQRSSAADIKAVVPISNPDPHQATVNSVIP